MQCDWMVQCVAEPGGRRNSPFLTSLDREELFEGVDAAVEAGLGGLWVQDHFTNGPETEEYESTALTSALAERTDDVDLGTLVCSITYRNPALLAKHSTTVDVLSGGRFHLGIGSGWHERDHRAYGFEFPGVDSRIDMLEEGLRIVEAMFTRESPSFEGDHFRIDGARNAPQPVSDPHPPIVVGASGPRMLRVAARYGDEWNLGPTGRYRGPPVEFLVEKFEEYATEAGRDPSTIDRSWLGHVLVAPDQEALEEYCDRIFPLAWGGSVGDEYLADADEARDRGDFFVGTPAEVASQLEAINELGFTRAQLFFLDYPEGRGMELFGDEVLPAL